MSIHICLALIPKTYIVRGRLRRNEQLLVAGGTLVSRRPALVKFCAPRQLQGLLSPYQSDRRHKHRFGFDANTKYIFLLFRTEGYQVAFTRFKDEQHPCLLYNVVPNFKRAQRTPPVLVESTLRDRDHNPLLLTPILRVCANEAASCKPISARPDKHSGNNSNT